MAAPPPLWQHEVASLGRDQTSKLPVVPIASRAAATGMDGGEEKLSETWRHIKGVARDDAKQYDLMDLVRNARREDTYQFPVPGVSSACRTKLCCRANAAQSYGALQHVRSGLHMGPALPP
jgi:hypothetical protein